MREPIKLIPLHLPNSYLMDERYFIYQKEGTDAYTIQYTIQGRKRIELDFGKELFEISTKIRNKKQKLPYSKHYYLHLDNKVNRSIPILQLYIDETATIYLHTYDETAPQNRGKLLYEIPAFAYIELQEAITRKNKLRPKEKEEHTDVKRVSKIRQEYIALCSHLRKVHSVKIIRDKNVPFKYAIPALNEIVKATSILEQEFKGCCKPKVLTIILNLGDYKLGNVTLGSTFLPSNGTIGEYIEGAPIRLSVGPTFFSNYQSTIFHEYAHILWHITKLLHGNDYRRRATKQHVLDPIFRTYKHASKILHIFEENNDLYPLVFKKDYVTRTDYLFSIEELMARNAEYYLIKRYCSESELRAFLGSRSYIPFASDKECIRYHQFLHDSIKLKSS